MPTSFNPTDYISVVERMRQQANAMAGLEDIYSPALTQGGIQEYINRVRRNERMPITNDAVRDGIEATVMILREKCMVYFKSTPQALESGNIRWRQPRQMGSRHFERDEEALKDKTHLAIDNEVILTLERHPDTLTLHMGILNRSKTMRDVQAGIRHYMHKWLPAVKLATTPEGSPSEWRKDRETVAYNARLDGRNARYMDFDISGPQYVTINPTMTTTISYDDVMGIADDLLPF